MTAQGAESPKSITKAELVAEMAASTKLSRRAVSRVLASLAEIAYREARNGFAIPGICKLKVVHKGATKCRNPATGKLLQIGERDTLKFVPLKRAKDAITPRREGLVQIIDEETISAPGAEAPPSPAAQPSPAANDEGQIVFSCIDCGGMVAAPAADVGSRADCPLCAASIVIPARDAAPASSTEEGMPRAEEFISFVCATCSQEIEAPIDIIGLEVNCPACASVLNVPTAPVPAVPEGLALEDDVRKPNLSSMTLRIDLSDLE